MYVNKIREKSAPVSFLVLISYSCIICFSTVMAFTFLGIPVDCKPAVIVVVVML